MSDLIVFLLDKSASMSELTSDTISGFNKFLNEQKALPGDAKFTLVLFDTKPNSVYINQDLQSIPELNDKIYVADGFSTAYLDALGKTIDETGQHLAEMHQTERPRKVIVVVLTDGIENASKEYIRQDILSKITHQTEKYDWKFIFLGANMDAVKEGNSMGISSSITYSANSKEVAMAYDRTSSLVSQSRT